MEGLDPLYPSAVECLQCSHSFQTMRVRPSFKRAVRSDPDFCLYYKDINADYYVVRVCPKCGFASTPSFSPVFKPEQKKLFQERIGSRWGGKDFSGKRTWKDALEAYKLALVCAQIKQENDRLIAGLLHHIAWLYREVNDAENEKKYLEFALEAYVRAYQNDRESDRDAKLMYLIGELNRRLGRYHEAARWFARVIHDKRITDAAMIQASRQQWAAMREEMLLRDMKPPEAADAAPS